jgi:phospholipase/carboxylesterase
MNRRLPSRRTRVGSPGDAAVPAVEPGTEPAPSKPASLARGAAGRPDAVPLRTAPGQARRDVDNSDNVFMPTGFEPGYAYPLLVWLPDPRGPAFDLGRVMSRVSLRNHVAVEPRGAVGDRETLVWQAIDKIRDRVRIDPRRIFLLGQGSGGTDAFRIACRHATAFAGVASIGGAFPHGEGLFARLDDVRRLPMLLCCRQQATEQVLRPTDATLRLFHAAGAMLAMRIYPGRHDLSKMILADVNRWLMDEICGAVGTRQLPSRR